MRYIFFWGVLIGLGTVPVSVAQKAKPASKVPAGVQKTTSKVDSARAKLKERSGLDVQVNNPVSGAIPGKKTINSLSTLVGETIPDLGLKAQVYKEQRSERKRKAQRAKLAKVQYEGIPMQRMVLKFGSGDRATIEEFHVLKAYKPISEYPRMTETRWYDTKARKLSSSVVKDKARALPLHGPYKRYSGGALIEEGFYYEGLKNGRWTRYDAKYNLLDKVYWSKGFLAESQITYYDSTHTKIKTVIPVNYGTIEGDYLSFYDGGQLMAQGKYERGEKVGRWVEYYQFRRQRKKEIQYPKSCWDDDFEPFVIREWDDKGKLLYDHSKDPRATAEVEDPEP